MDKQKKSVLLMVISIVCIGLLVLGARYLDNRKKTYEGVSMEMPPVPTVTRPAPTEAAPTQPVPEETEADPAAAPSAGTEPDTFLLTFAGDCTLGSTASNAFAGHGFPKTVGEDYGYPFRNVASYFENDDFTMVNLEGPLTDSGYPVQKQYSFRGATAYTAILSEHGVDAVTVANNHTQDCGPTGYADTLEALDSAGVAYVERDNTKLVTTDSGLTIGLYGTVYYDLNVKDMTEKIAGLKQQGAELIIVAAHWGNEGSYHTTALQTDVGRAAIDAGANIVFGTHPHVLQPIESYNGGMIYYSLGNFSFGGNSKPDDFDTALIQQEVIRQPDGSVELGGQTRIPASISSIPERNNYQPTVLEPETEDYARVLSKLDGSFTGTDLKIH